MLTLAACSVQADERHALISSLTPAVSPATTWWRVIAVPAELVGLLLGVQPMADAMSERSSAAQVSSRFDSYAFHHAERASLKDMLVENRVRVQLRDDVYVHCDVEQQPVFARSDQVLVKFGLQYRFR